MEDFNENDLAELLIIADRFKKAEPSPDEWSDFGALIKDMKAYAIANGQAIVEEDRPAELKWAWRCTNTGKTWSIRIPAIKRYVESLESSGETEKADVLMRAAQTQIGKANLLDVINGK